MTDGAQEALDYAIKDAEHAFRLLEFSIRTLNVIEAKTIDLSVFGQETTILLDDENVTFSDGYFTSQENAEISAKVAIGVSFAASAIALDNLFEATGRQRDPASNEEVYLLWTLVYAVRNAFAHGIAEPKWLAHPRYQRTIRLTLANKEIVIDLAAVNEQEFAYEHIGGFANWLNIKDRAFALIRP